MCDLKILIFFNVSNLLENFKTDHKENILRFTEKKLLKTLVLLLSNLHVRAGSKPVISDFPSRQY